jgi:hypothetical protein
MSAHLSGVAVSATAFEQQNISKTALGIIFILVSTMDQPGRCSVRTPLQVVTLWRLNSVDTTQLVITVTPVSDIAAIRQYSLILHSLIVNR